MADRPRPIGWLRQHPTGADASLAALLCVMAFIGLTIDPGTVPHRDPDAVALILVMIQTLPLVRRRRYPAMILLITGVALMILQGMNYPSGPESIGPLIATYSLAAHGTPRRRVFTVGVIGAVVLTGFMVAGMLTDAHDATFWNLMGTYVIFSTAFVMGDNFHRRRQRVADLEIRAIDLEHARQLETEQAVNLERARIARELHDVVAHSVSVMVVQAGAARRIMGQDPGRAEQALVQVERTGREALTEMRRLLGVLRTPERDGPATLTPQPGLARLADLVASDPDLPVSLAITGEARDLSPGVDLSAYRIVQEGLTNVRKHAGPTGAEVRVEYGDRALRVSVADRGRGASASPGTLTALEPGARPDRLAGGHGLLGMADRVAVLGGRVEAGPRPGGGWILSAELPYEATVDAVVDPAPIRSSR